MKIKSFVALSALTFAANAMAGDLYVVGSIGQSKVKDFNKNALDADLAADFGAVSSSDDRSDTAYKLQLGYQINKNFAVEGGYVDLGKVTYAATVTGGTLNVDVKSSGWNLAAVGILPLNEQFSLFGKLGAIHATTKLGAQGTGVVSGWAEPGKESGWSANYGLGASYNINKQVAIRAEYERFDSLGGDNVGGKSDVDLFSVGVAYKF